MKRWHLALIVALFMLLGLPAYAYGDPSGGTLFQILMPLLAVVWGMWMIFVGRIRRGVSNAVRRLRSSESDESASQ